MYFMKHKDKVLSDHVEKRPLIIYSDKESTVVVRY